MRLQAATALVQLAALPVYSDAIMPNFALLAVTMQVGYYLLNPESRSHVIQDPCFQVRLGFLVKIIAFLTRSATDPRFNAVVFLTAHDPEREVRDKV
jgi:sister chromatid cohesion protein PDS5